MIQHMMTTRRAQPTRLTFVSTPPIYVVFPLLAIDSTRTPVPLRTTSTPSANLVFSLDANWKGSGLTTMPTAANDN